KIQVGGGSVAGDCYGFVSWASDRVARSRSKRRTRRSEAQRHLVIGRRLRAAPTRRLRVTDRNYAADVVARQYRPIALTRAPISPSLVSQRQTNRATLVPRRKNRIPSFSSASIASGAISTKISFASTGAMSRRPGQSTTSFAIRAAASLA